MKLTVTTCEHLTCEFEKKSSVYVAYSKVRMLYIGTITVFKNHQKVLSYVCWRNLRWLFASLAKRSEIEKSRDSDMRHF